MKQHSPLQIRPARPQDIPLLLNLICGLAQHEGRPEAVCATEQSLHRHLFELQSAQALIAEAEGLPAGYAVYYPLFSTFAGSCRLYVEDIYILPELRGRGYGTVLLRYLGAEAVQRGYMGLSWSCLDTNTPGLAYYHHIGAAVRQGSTAFSLEDSALANFL